MWKVSVFLVCLFCFFSCVGLWKRYFVVASGQFRTTHFDKKGHCWKLGSGPILGPKKGHLGPEPTFIVLILGQNKQKFNTPAV